MANNLTQRLDLRQSQNLVMTPQLQQAIKLLQMNNVELSEFLEEELEKNPLLEKAEAEGSAPAEGEAAPEIEARNERDDVEQNFDEGWTGNEAETNAPQDSTPDFDSGNMLTGVGAGGNRNFDDPELSLENTLAQTKTLRDHLLEQLYMDMEDARDRMIGGIIVDMLDETGYLRVGIDEISERLGGKPERIREILAQMRKYDPPGIFAKDLSDCLALQLEDQGKLDKPMQTLLAHLSMLADHDVQGLMKICGVNETYLQDMIAEIRSLNPRPASSFEHLIVQTIVPDVIMKPIPKSQGGGWRVELNNDTLPRVLINQQYLTEVSSHAKNKQDKEYLSTQMNSASWLVKALDQRAKTILKVAAEIIEQQDAFFLYGIEFLRPLTLKDIAEKIDMHESTVSRVTSGKYIGTPRGLFELKYFFSTALVSADGTSHSSESIKARVRSLIEGETIDNVLSDDALVEILQKEGIDLARRTVAKYRDMLNIPSSVMRRKLKKNGR
ncbi:MAG: polymerase sigma-54 factor RpoN [Micavibrio sp.]|nr:polymerase sigma-54 factor RpoN [Micavibrio sp.]